MFDRVFEDWMDGLTYLLFDELITYYTYFTITLAEILYLNAFRPDIASPFTVILTCSILSVVVFAYYKGKFEGTKRELWITREYVALFVVYFVAGMLIDWKANIIIWGISLGISYLLMILRIFQQTIMFVGNYQSILVRVGLFLTRLLKKKNAFYLSQVLILGLPMVMFIWALWQTSLTENAKLFISVVYVAFSPLLSYMEDSLVSQNIFELMYSVTWSEEYEEESKRMIDEYEKDPEKVKEEFVNIVINNIREIEKEETKK